VTVIWEDDAHLDRWAEEHAGLVDAAAEFAAGRRWVSAPVVQRHSRVGFATAAMLLEVLEGRGVVGPMRAAGHRDVLADCGAR
jgi:DNA segregation ATPase FtsK/SpoIIIE-like protein